MVRVAIVEDDKSIRREMTVGLQKWGIEVIETADFKNIQEWIQNENPDLIVMDITLPYFDGFYWTQKIRGFSNTPIMFVSAAEMDPNAIRAISIGADDYLTKPFSVDVFVSKVQAIMKRITSESEFSQTIRFENYSLDIITNRVTRDTDTVRLTTTESIILRLLFLSPNDLVTKPKIVNSIWQTGNFTDENILNVNVSRLRSKLEPIGLGTKIITEYGKGYRLTE